MSTLNAPPPEVDDEDDDGCQSFIGGVQCVREPGHKGKHIDGLGSDWTDEEAAHYAKHYAEIDGIGPDGRRREPL